VDYFGMPGAYGAQPEDTIQYIGVHDDPDWFDAMNLKLATAVPRADRVRMARLGMDIVALSQGVPFFMAGDDILRSKSADRNSYNSGDWFNRLDYSARTSAWGSGLPPAQDNQSNWPVMKPLLANPALRPLPEDVRRARAHVLEVLAIRRTSPLFRLRTEQEVKDRLRFYNTGPGQVPGVLAYGLSDATGAVDRLFSRVVVLLNADPASRSVAVPELVGQKLRLHPLHLLSADARVRTATFDRAAGTFTVPGRTAVVFVDYRGPY
jgi:pullulanase